MMRIHIASVGVLAPGLPTWESAQRVAADQQSPVEHSPLAPPVPKCLPPAERRRSGAAARLAIAVAEQAIEGCGISPEQMSMVFAAAEAAGDITHQLCDVLAGTREVSPTVFHNSVHNAPLGYFSIATHARGAGTSVCRGPWTFAAALVLAAVEAQVDARPVLLVCYDSPVPFPLNRSIAITEPTAIALVLTPSPSSDTLATCELAVTDANDGTQWPSWIPAAWHSNASARGIAMLSAWARRDAGAVFLPYAPSSGLEVRCRA